MWRWLKPSLNLVSNLILLRLWQLMMMMMNCFCDMVDWWKVFCLISSRDHCQRSSTSRVSNMLQTGFEPAQNLSSGLVEWSCAVVITTTPRHRYTTLLPEGRINFKRRYLKIFKLSELRIFRSNLFHSMTTEGKKKFWKKLCFTLNWRMLLVFLVLYLFINGNNVKKVFWRMTFINFIEAA